ncbi:hypothetical protein J437_LFUL014023 [Ladona fulva]|uniref:HTH CENPB-type domain-containing protein n=1 Tax=Ladona fulva TaxID=123851 RepID=A0A8K0KL92_LADFU|nr:hypothetical protein J437_LFUL014023 [Ladona fulva]
MMFGLTLSDVRKLAFEVAERNGLPHNFNVEKGMAGKKWLYAFMKRHPKLSCRQPEATSMARAKGFNKQKVYAFFDLLETFRLMKVPNQEISPIPKVKARVASTRAPRHGQGALKRFKEEDEEASNTASFLESNGKCDENEKEKSPSANVFLLDDGEKKKKLQAVVGMRRETEVLVELTSQRWTKECGRRERS